MNSESLSLRFENHIAYIVAFSVLSCFFLFVGHMVLRGSYGLDAQMLVGFRCFVIGTAICTAIFAIPKQGRWWLLEHPRLLPLPVLGVFLLPLCGWWLGGVGWYLFLGIVLAALPSLFKVVRFNSFEWILLVSAGFLNAGLYFLWVNSQVEIRATANPDIHSVTYYPLSLLKEVAVSGVMYRDFWQHFSIIHMLQAWGQATTGLDGFVPFGYHLGGHFWCAALGRLLGEEVFVFAPVALLLIWFPVVVFALLLAGACLRKCLGSTNQFYLVAGLLCLWAYLCIDRNVSFFQSTTFTPSLVVLLLLFPAVVFAWSSIEERGALFKPSCFLGMASGLVAVFKMQGGLFLLAFTAYIVLNRLLKNRWLVLILMGGGAIVFLQGVGYFTGIRIGFDGAVPLQTKIFLMADTFLESVFSFIPVLFYYLVFVSERMQLERRFNDWVFASMAIGAGMMLILGQEYWFVYSASFLVFLMILAHPSFESDGFAMLKARFYAQLKVLGSVQSKRERPWAMVVGAVCLLLLAIGVGRMGYSFAVYLPQVLDVSRRSVDRVDASLLGVVGQVEGLGANEGLAVFIPESNSEYWHFGEEFLTRAFYIPALTGVPVLKGLSVADDTCLRDCALVGYSYPVYAKDAFTDDSSDESICQRAHMKGFDRVFRLESLTRLEVNRLVRCE